MEARWVVERQRANEFREVLTVVEVYTADENKELVKQENKRRRHKRYFVKVEADGNGKKT
jgi:hypothetical protein